MDNNLNVKVFVPCKAIHPYNDAFGFEIRNTCIGIFRNIACFDFPSLPRSFVILALVEGTEGSYHVSMNILNNDKTILIKGINKLLEIPSDTKGYINIVFEFKDVVFSSQGIYYLQFVSNDKGIYEYEFLVNKIEKPEYNKEELEQILNDPETIKNSLLFALCNKCGHKNKYSLNLDNTKQIGSEKLPEGESVKCKNCGEDIHISPEARAQMKFSLGTKNAVDTINRNLRESSILAISGFLEPALILQVSAFEAFMRDTFVSSYKNWFIYLIDETKDIEEQEGIVRDKIIELTRKLKIKEDFYDYIFKNKLHTNIATYNETLKLLMFGDDKVDPKYNKINFQQLLKEMGCFWAYRIFLGIDIIPILKEQREFDYLNHLVESFKSRHRIIHKSSEFALEGQVTSKILEKNSKAILLIRRIIVSNILELDKKNLRLRDVIADIEELPK